MGLWGCKPCCRCEVGLHLNGFKVIGVVLLLIPYFADYSSRLMYWSKSIRELGYITRK